MSKTDDDYYKREILNRDDGGSDRNAGEKSVVKCSTSAGSFSIRLHKNWSPNGYERAVELFQRGFYDNSHFFRVVPGFLVQFGISYTSDSALQKFASSTFPDDPQLSPRIVFDEGVVAFAGSGSDSRTSHLFIAYEPRYSLGTQPWESPIGTVVEGMQTIRDLNHEYGDMPPWGHGPEQNKIRKGGEEYMLENFPHLDKFIHCDVFVEEEEEEEEAPLVPKSDDYYYKEEAKEEASGRLENNELYEEAERDEESREEEEEVQQQEQRRRPVHIRSNTKLKKFKRMLPGRGGDGQGGESFSSYVALPVAAAFVAAAFVLYKLKKGYKKKVTAKSV